MHLFLVVLGGRTLNSHIELHDVRWVIGTRIEDTYDQLCREWFGEIKGLHIDSYMKVKFIDGYRINLKERNKKQLNKNTAKNLNKKENKSLWFINIGGYNNKSLSELHHFGLIVARTSKEAKSKAKKKWLCMAEKQHKDDLFSLENIKEVDNCHSIKSLGKWEIYLTPDEQNRSQLLIPDWYGFMRIDKKKV